VKRRVLLLAAASCACRGGSPSHLELARSALVAARGVTRVTAADEAWALGELSAIAERVRAVHDSGGSAARALTRVLFDELGFVREVTSTELGFVLLPSVLRLRRGSCVGRGTVYLALAEALGFEARGVLLPGHFYVRQAGPDAPSNVELLRRGEAMPDSWYTRRFPLPGGHSRYYARPLSSREVLGVIEYDVGNERRRQERLVEAERAYASATELFPEFSEAHASLGAARHLLGNYAAAAASYRAARSLNPELPGLQANIALLEAEQGVSPGK
jgi:regulator of sirC expression with transglutaminase-like and TPR domain